METRWGGGGGGVTIENFCWRGDLMFNRALEVFQKREAGQEGWRKNRARGLYKKVFVCVFTVHPFAP